jgi:hypothetical protein
MRATRRRSRGPWELHTIYTEERVSLPMLVGDNSSLRSKPLNERFYEKVIKVKADVAALLIFVFRR